MRSNPKALSPFDRQKIKTEIVDSAKGQCDTATHKPTEFEESRPNLLKSY